MKFIYITDTHNCGINPLRRKGSFVEDMLDKYNEIARACHLHKVDCVVHGGDWGETIMMSLALHDKFMAFVDASGVDWHIVPGNHDSIGSNFALSKNTLLAHMLRRESNIRDLSDRPIECNGIVVGIAYSHGIEARLRNEGLKAPECKHLKVAVVHALITPEKLPDQANAVCVDEIETDYDVILVAHNHAQYGEVRVGNTSFWFPGALARTSVALTDLERRPSYLLIDTVARTVEMIPLQCAKPAEELFDLATVEAAKSDKAQLSDFAGSILTTEIQGEDILQDLRTFAQANAVEKHIETDLVARAERAYKNVDDITDKRRVVG